MKIYIDNDYKCHVSQGEGMTEIETSFFDNKAPEFIEGYRFVPAGETWTRSDGVQFQGEMIAPWKDYNALERAQLMDMAETLNTIKEVYENDE